MTMTTATFRFYAELNDFLAPQHRGHEFSADCAEGATVKHMIEALAAREHRIVLKPEQQLRELFDRLDLARNVPPFERIKAQCPRGLRLSV